jgi:hypothetical protein
MPIIKTKPGARVMVGYPNARGDYEGQIDILAHGLANEDGEFIFDINSKKIQDQEATVRIRIPRQENNPIEYKLKLSDDQPKAEIPDVEEIEPDDKSVETSSGEFLSEQS